MPLAASPDFRSAAHSAPPLPHDGRIAPRCTCAARAHTESGSSGNERAGLRSQLASVQAELAQKDLKIAKLGAKCSQQEQDAAALRAALEQERSEKAALREQNEQLRTDLRDCRQRLREALQIAFGQKSERYAPDSAAESGAEPDDAGIPADGTPKETHNGEPVRTKQPRHRQARRTGNGARKPRHWLQDGDLEEEVIILEPPGDRSRLNRVGKVDSVEVRYIPGRWVRRIYRRNKYRDPATGKIVMAELPKRLIKKGMPSESVLAYLLISKFLDHLPLYRLQERISRKGLNIPLSTLGDWVQRGGQGLLQVYEALKAQLLASGSIQVDETRIAVQDPSKKGKNHLGYFWVHLSPLTGDLVIEYRPGRGRKELVEFLAPFTGALQSDGYVAYDVFDQDDAITTYGCWAHARRYFVKALDSGAQRAPKAMELIQQLYAIERHLRENDADAPQRRRYRQTEAAPVLHSLKQWLEQNPGQPGTPWHKAVRYTLKRWEKLTRYVEDGRIEIDNNLVENAIRPIALGRKNYLFAGSHAAAANAAVIYSLLGTCLLQGVNPEEWLTDVLHRIPTCKPEDIPELLPSRWRQTRINAPP